MKHDRSTRPGPAEIDSRPKRQASDGRNSGSVKGRSDARRELTVQAFVAIPSLTSRAYECREISRSGMFLAFKGAHSTRLEFEQGNIELGTNVEIAFAVSMAASRHRFNVRARIARITKKGIGVKFTTRNPPQLSALRELFAQADEEVEPLAPQEPAAPRSETRQTLSKPSDTSAWKDWELVD